MSNRQFRWEVNVQTGTRTQVALTDDEIAIGLARQAQEAAEAVEQQRVSARKAARQARLDALLDKLEADPTILDRIR